MNKVLPQITPAALGRALRRSAAVYADGDHDGAARIMGRLYGYRRAQYAKLLQAAIERYHEERLRFFRVKGARAAHGKTPDTHHYDEHLHKLFVAFMEVSRLVAVYFADTSADVKQGETAAKGRRNGNSARSEAAKKLYRDICQTYARLKQTDPGQPEKHYRACLRVRFINPETSRPISPATISRALRDG